MSLSPKLQPQTAIDALLNGVIDYAGLFPPARLPLDEAFTEFLRYQGITDSWMLSRFVIRAEQLPDLASLCRNSELHPRVGLSVLVGGAMGRPRDAVSGAFELIRGIEDATGGAVRGDMLETSIALDQDLDARAVMDAFRKALTSADRKSDPVFFEAPWSSDASAHLRAIAEAVRSARDDGFRFGLKIRSGGLRVELFPSSTDIARFIATCLDHDIPFKATAGLHHPIRHYRPELGVMMHGFLNVMGAAILGHTHGLGAHDLLPIIEETSGDAFGISPDHLNWRQLSASSEEIIAARIFATSFGSCSFDDPRDDLRALGWLPGAVASGAPIHHPESP